MTKSFSLIATFSLFLTACASNPASYLPSGSDPIINIESDIAEKIKVDAGKEKLIFTNLTKSPISVVYKLFWYDENGVTQLFSGISDSSDWKHLFLSDTKYSVILVKPTEESFNYRLYLRTKR